MGKRIIAIDHDSATLGLIADLLDAEGYVVHCSLGYGVSAMNLQELQPDLILLELPYRDSDATLLFLDQLRQSPATRTIPIVVSSTDRRVLDVLAAPLHHLGCTALVKPFDLDQFLACIAQAIHPQQARGYALHDAPAYTETYLDPSAPRALQDNPCQCSANH
jgi:CheY-like chemotaxis protein